MPTIRLIILSIFFAALSEASLLTLTLVSDVNVGAPGAFAVYAGSLTNNSGGNVFLNGMDANIAYSELIVDFTGFFSNAPFFLADGETYSGPLFDVFISAVAVPGDYFGSFNIQGGISQDASDLIASGDFRVTVSEVPEPAPRGLWLSAIAFGILLRKLRQRQRVSPNVD